MDTKKQLKISLWTPDLNQTGGVQRYSSGILEGLNKIADVKVVPLTGSGFLAKCFFGLRTLIHVGVKRPDIVWCTHLHLARAVQYFPTFMPELWISLHGIECWNIDNARDIASLNRAKKLLCVSHYTKKRVAENHPELQPKLQWLPNHLSQWSEAETTVAESRREFGVPDESILLLTVARLSQHEQYKGHREILRAMSCLTNDFPRLHYLIAGTGDDLPNLRQLARELGIEQRVHFTGWLTDRELELAYRAADLFVLPGTGEGFGIVLLEALVRGVPVLASSEDGSREAVLNGELGDMASPSRPDSVLDSLRHVLQLIQTKQYPHSAEQLRTKVLEHYGPEARDARLKRLLANIS